MSQTRPQIIKRYGLAILAPILALLLSLLGRSIIERVPFLFFFAALAVSTSYGGLGPGMLTALLSTLVVNYFLLPPYNSIAFDATNLTILGLFLLVAFIISWVYDARRRAEAAAWQQREQLQTTLASIGDGVIVTDERHRVSFINAVAEQLVGWKQHEAVGHDLSELFRIVNEHTRQPVENPVERVMREGAIIGLANHTILISRHGEEFAIDDSASPIRDNRGQIKGAVLVFRDVTYHRAAQDAQAELASIVASSTDAIISEDLDGTITSWNKAAEKMYGYTTEEVINKPITILVPPGHIDDSKLLIDRIKAGERIEHFETQRMHKDGTVREVSLTLSPVYDAQGNMKGFSKIARDITERKRTENNQRFLAAASDAFAHSIDFETTLKSVAEMAVPAMADWCTIDLLDETGNLREVAISHTDPRLVPLVQQLRATYTPDDPRPNPPRIVAQTGKSLLIPKIRWEDIESTGSAPDQATADLLRSLNMRSLMYVALKSPRKILGVISLTTNDSGRYFTPEDVPLVEEMARRGAIAIENAQLYAEAQQARKTAERLADRAIRLQTVTSYLSKLLQPTEVARAIVEQCLSALEASESGMVVTLVDNDTWLEIMYAQGYSDENMKRWSRMPMSNQSLPIVYSVSHREPLFLNSQAQWRVLSPTLPEGMTSPSLALVPLVIENAAIGALVLSFDEAQLFGAEDRAFIMALAQQCAQALERARSYRAEQQARLSAEASQWRLTFLAQTSELLSASLDFQTTLVSVSKLLVPAIADWCTIHLVQNDGSIAQIVTYHSDPAKISLAEAYRQRYPSNPDAATGVYNVLRTGKSEFNPEVTDEILTMVVTDPEQLRLLRQFGFKAGILVPLIVRGKTLGVIQVIVAESGRALGLMDVTLAEELARRASIALENSLLYSEAHEQRERLQVTLSSIGDAVIATDKQGLITFINPVAQSLTGWTSADARGKALHMIFRIVNATTRQTVESPVEKVIREGTIVGLANHTLLLARDGREIPIDDSGAPIYDEQHQITGVILVFRDVTDRQRAEGNQQFLLEAGTILAASLNEETTFDNLAHLIVPYLADSCVIDIVDTDGVLHRVAVAAADKQKENTLRELMRRYPPSPLQTTNLGKIQSHKPLIITEAIEDLLDAYAPDTDFSKLLYSIGTQSAMRIPLIAHDQLIGLITIGIAESGRRYETNELALAEELALRATFALENVRLYQEAQEAIRARNEFLSVAAHELKTPVTSMRGFAQLLLRQFDKRGTVDPIQLQHALTTIDAQSSKLTKLINQLLDLSRLESGRLTLERRDIDLVLLVQEVVMTVQKNTQKHTITVHSPSTLAVVADQLRLEQVLINLLDNAVKYSPDGGPIEIEFSADAQPIRLSVTDHGIGIPADRRQHIFDRFYQAHGDGYLGGMGLGLYISRQIIDLHGGQLEVEFPPEGGTRFNLSLP